MAGGRRRNKKDSEKWPEVRIHGQWQGLGRFVGAQKEKIIGRLETAKTRESRDAQIGVGTMYEELCITC